MYTKQLGKVLKKALEGWSCTSTHLPMAKASAVVVATTSLLLGLMNTCRQEYTATEAHNTEEVCQELPVGADLEKPLAAAVSGRNRR